MSVELLLKDLENKGVQLWEEDGQLKYRAPRGVMHKELLSKISENKDEILSITKTKTEEFKEIIPDPENRYKPFPLTDVQRAYWIGRADAYELGGVSTHFYLELDVEDLDIEKLNFAWQKMVEKHDILRIVFTDDGFQKILKEVPEYKFRIYTPENKDELLEVRDEMSHQVIPANSWPLFDIRCASLPDSTKKIFISFDCLIGDAYSQLKLFEEWIDIYFNPLEIKPPGSISFRDYVLGEMELKKGSKYEKAKEYWLNRIDDLKAGPQLPLVLNPSLVKKPVFKRVQSELSCEAWKSLKKKASALRITPTSVLLSAFSHVLSKWSRTAVFTLNMTLFNRLQIHPEVNDIVGEFTSLDMLNIDFTTKGSFREKTIEIQSQLMKDLDNIYFSGVEVIRELMIRRKDFKPGSIPVVFTGAVGFESNTETKGLHRIGKISHSITQTPQIWLDCQVYENGGILKMNWDYVEELFPDGMIDEMFKSFTSLLNNLVQDEKEFEKIYSVRIPDEKRKMRDRLHLESGEKTPVMLHELFEKQAKLNPANTAVIDQNQSVSYRYLDVISSNLGHLLRNLGAKPDTLVAVLIDKGWEQVASVIGIMKSGAAYLPIDPSMPYDRIKKILKDGEVKLIVTGSKYAKDYNDFESIEVVVFDNTDLTKKISSPDPVHTSDNLAYVIYTSGSTGNPKGVMIDHKSAANTIIDINNRFDMGMDDRTIALSGLNFDLSVYDIFGMLACGGAVVFPDREKTRDPQHWLELVEKEKISIWNTVPMFMQMLVEYTENTKRKIPDSLRVVLMSGDWIPVNLPDRIKKLSGTEIISLGGATEASIWSIFYHIREVKKEWTRIPYGRSLINQSCKVLDSDLTEVPDWVTGDIYIGGDGLSRGYFKDEEKTSKSFIIDHNTGERLYRTGDMGRYLPDGNIEFLGREDFQVKINGFRVELGEINAAAVEFPEVKDAFFTTIESRKWDRRIVGYVVPKEESGIDTERLIRFMRTKLPEYMVPVSVKIISEIPLTSNGKVDQKLLGNFEMEVKENSSIPVTELEEKILEIWNRFLGEGDLSTTDNFFELGGNSLISIQIINSISSELNVNLPMHSLFEAPTISLLSEYIERNSYPKEWSPIVPIREEGDKIPFFCFHPSDGYVFHYKKISDFLGKEYPVYGIESKGLDGGFPPYKTIKEMAEFYVSAIRKIQPKGPYRMGGWCMGGFPAFEVSRILHNQGEDIDKLILIDTPTPEDWAELNRKIDKDFLEVMKLLVEDPEKALEFMGTSKKEFEEKTEDEKLTFFYDGAHFSSQLPPGMDFEQFKLILPVIKANMGAMCSYEPEEIRFKGSTLFINATDLPEHWGDFPAYWSSFIKSEFSEKTVEGDHYELVAKEENAEKTASFIRYEFEKDVK